MSGVGGKLGCASIHTHDGLMTEGSQTGGPLRRGAEPDRKRSGPMGWEPALPKQSRSVLNSKAPEQSVPHPGLPGCQEGVGGHNRVSLTAILLGNFSIFRHSPSGL